MVAIPKYAGKIDEGIAQRVKLGYKYPDPLFANTNDIDIRSGVSILAFDLGFTGDILDSNLGMADFADDVDFLFYNSEEDLIDLDGQ